MWFSSETEALFAELKEFIYAKIINHSRVNRQDWRARKVVTALFRAYWQQPVLLPQYVLMRASEELGSPEFARLNTDHIAGMSDRFALEEYRSLEQPSPDRPL